MKGIKKFLSLTLCIALLLSAIPLAVSAANASGDYYYTVEGGKATITAYTNTIDEEVNIPSTIDGYPVIAIGDGAFANKSEITKITIPEGVLSIGNYAFAACKKLGSVILADSISHIGESAFYNCPLNSITLPKNLTIIPAECFADCHGLQAVELQNNVTTIGNGAFKGCYNLTEILIPSSVTTIAANVFQENYRLSDVYFCGTKDQWNNIQIGSNNDALNDATISFHMYRTVYVAPTCVKLGHALHTCLICDHTYIDEDTTSTLAEHDYNEEFTVDKEPTDFEEGIKSRHCKNCDAVTDMTTIPIISLASGNYSDTVKWVIKNDGTLVILGTGSIANNKLPIYTPWHEYADIITALEISETIAYLGNNSFSSLENLTIVTVNGINTELGIYVFPLDADLVIKCYSGSDADYYAQRVDHTITYFSAPSVPVIESIVGNTATLKKISGYEYSIDRYTWQKSNVFTIEKNEIITFYQRVAATNTSSASPSSDAAKGISVSAPEVVLVGYDIICIKPRGNFEFGLEGNLWQENNEFKKWIIPGETYTVYQRYNGDDDVFAVYDTNGTNITVDGTNKPLQKNSQYFVWLKKHLFTTSESNNYAADFNTDYSIDILDLIALKNDLLEKI